MNFLVSKIGNSKIDIASYYDILKFEKLTFQIYDIKKTKRENLKSNQLKIACRIINTAIILLTS